MFYSNDEKILIILIVGIIIENYVIILICDLIDKVDWVSVVFIGFLFNRFKKNML